MLNRTSTGLHSFYLLPLFLFSGGCVVESSGGRVTVVLRDATSGRGVTECLLVTVFSRTDTSVETPMGGANTTYKDTNGRIQVISSYFLLEEPPVVRPLIYLGLLWFTRDGYYVYTVHRSGYRPVVFSDVSKKAKACILFTISLEPEHPGDPTSDRQVLDDAVNSITNTIPAIPTRDPLRSRLVSIVASQVRRVQRSSRDSRTSMEAASLVEQINLRFGEQVGE